MSAATAAPAGPAAGLGGSAPRGRGVVAVVVLAVALLGAALLAGQPDDVNEAALDPRSVAPDGARGLVLVLRELDASLEVLRTVPGDDVDTALVLQDRSDVDGRDALLGWVRRGGVLVVTDSGSRLAPGGDDAPCPAALDGLDAIDTGTGLVGPTDGDGCYDGFVRVEVVGEGTIVGLRSPEPLLNRSLARGDGAALGAALLAPVPGTRVAVVEAVGGGGETALLDLIAPRVGQALLQLVVAAALYALWRARRLGRPVAEPQPVAVAGSELVAAVGRLLDRQGRPEEAAATLRSSLVRRLESRLGVAHGTPSAVLGAAVAGPSGLPADRCAAALGERPVPDEATLVAVAADLDHIRRSVLG